MKLLAPLLLIAIAASAAEWQAGAAAVDITPDYSIWLQGYASRTKPSEAVREPIHAKALALKDEAGQIAVVVTIDLAGIRREIAEPVAARVQNELHIPRERLLFNVSHTHSAPIVGELSTVYEPLMGSYLEKQKAAIARYTADLPKLLFRVIEQAVSRLQPAEISFEQGFAGFAVNRRRVGHRAYPGPVDQDVPVLTAKAGDRYLAILFGYACHNTVMSDYTIHGDYAGFAQKELEHRFPGAVALFVQGAGADANPLPRGTPEIRERYGTVLADAVERVMIGKKKPIRGNIVAAIDHPELTFEGPFDRARWQKETASQTPVVAAHGKRMLAMLDSGGKIPDRRDYVVEAWRLGTGPTVLALGGELTVDYALKFKQRYGFDTTWIAGYSNETFGYIPSLRVWEEGGYEGGDAFRFSTFPGRFTSDVEDRITASVERVMAKVAKK